MSTLYTKQSKDIILIFRTIFLESNNMVSFGLFTSIYFATISLIELLIKYKFCEEF